MMGGVDDAVAQAEWVRSGAVSTGELVERAIDRVQRLDPRLNAVIHPRFDAAREEAQAALPHGPMRGVPFLVKDALCHQAGQPYHHGLASLRDADWRAAEDSHLAVAFRQAGLIALGRTNVPELTTATTTEPRAYGATRNPWALDHSPGGSSGGSAAAVASGMVPAAHGNDMSGSIRLPASACGLVGLKPTRGRTSLGPHFAEYWGPLTQEGVLTRTVRDTAALLDALDHSSRMNGYEPYRAPPLPRSLTESRRACSGPLRIGVRTRLPGSDDDSHPACRAAVETAAALLDERGHVVEEASPAALDSGHGTHLLGTIITAGVARDLERYSALIGREIATDELEPINAMLAEWGQALPTVTYLEALESLHSHARRLAAWWDGGQDVLLTPTLPQPPPQLGELGPDKPASEVSARSDVLSEFLAPWNMTGQPAISVPVHVTETDLPIGVQLVGAFGREDLLVELATSLEESVRWFNRRPHFAWP